MASRIPLTWGVLWPDGKEVNPKARYRNENVSLMELKMANNQRI